jgi:hypothetical protein
MMYSTNAVKFLLRVQYFVALGMYSKLIKYSILIKELEVSKEEVVWVIWQFACRPGKHATLGIVIDNNTQEYHILYGYYIHIYILRKPCEVCYNIVLTTRNA